MKRLLKWLLGLVGVLILLLVIAVVTAIFIFDSDKIKTELASEVKARTSADLMIKQDLTLSFFPWLSVKTGDMSLSQPEGFPDKSNALTISELSASIKLIPLFTGNIELGSVELSGTQLNLIRDKKGRSNIQVMMSNAEKYTAENSDKEDDKTAEGSQSDAGSEISITKISLSDFTLNQFGPKQRLTQSFVLQQFVVNEFELDKLVPIQAKGSFKSGSEKTKAQWSLSTNIKVSRDFKAIELKQLEATITEISNKLTSLGVIGETSIIQSDEGSKVNYKGVMTLDGQAFNLDFAGAFTTFKDISLNISAPSLQLDQWIESSDKNQNTEQTAATDFSPIGDFLKRARVKGSLAVERLSVKGMTFDNVKADLSNKGTTLWLKPFNAGAFKGQLSTIASINFASKPLALTVQPELKNIEVGDLLANLFEVERLAGLGSLNLNMTTKGLDLKQMLTNLNGTGNINLSDGKLIGLDLQKLIETGLSLELLNNSESYKGNTSFANLKGDIKANQGMIDLNGFILSSPLFDLVGKASTDANDESLAGNFKLHLKGQLKERLEKKYPELTGIDLPFELKGSWNDPKPSIDIESLLKAKFEDQVQGKLDEEKKKVEDKIKDKLIDKLFGKPKKKN